MRRYKNLTELYEAYKDNSPDMILERIREFFAVSGKYYRRGYLTEEEFYFMTHYGTVYNTLCKLKNNICVDWKLLNHNQDFKESWIQWKETGTVQIKPWMKSCIKQFGNFEKAVDWVFSVIDVCKIPLCQFDGIYEELGIDGPDVFWTLTSDTTIEMILRRRCTDISKLLCDPFPVGKRFYLHFDGGLEADLIVNEKNEKHYVCFGTITDYVEIAQRIDIEWDEGGAMDVYFNKRSFTPWQTLMRTVPNPVPHRKWLPYEALRLARDLRLETEYKILRLPYLLGIEEADVSNKSEEIHAIATGKIIRLFDT